MLLNSLRHFISIGGSLTENEKWDFGTQAQAASWSSGLPD